MLVSDRPSLAPTTNQFARTLRIAVLIGISADLLLIAVRVARYPALFAMPGAFTFLIEPIVALIVYAVVAGALPWLTERIAHGPSALRIGALVGVIGGAIEVVSTALESLVSLPQTVVAVTTGVAQVSLFLLFAVAGFLGSRRTQRFWSGLSAAIGSAMVAIVIVVTFGFLLITTSLPTLAHNEIGDPDYLRSGWTDISAFAMANTFDAGFTHLVEAPIIASVLGAAGSGIGQIGRRNQQVKGLRGPAPEEQQG